MGGKSDAPAPPDYMGQANAQAQGNLNTARATTTANRIDQVTPYGSIKYTQGDGFDEAGYNAAVQRYEAQERMLDENPNGAMLRQYMSAIGQPNARPDRTQFITNPDHWASQIELSDAGRQLLDQYNTTSLNYAQLQDGAMRRLTETLRNPLETSDLPGVRYGVNSSGLPSLWGSLDKSGIPSLQSSIDTNGLPALASNVDGNTGMDSWQRYSDLLLQRMNPDLDARQSALDTKLANQGLTAGSEGWGIQQQQFAKERNDAGISAQLAGAQLQDQMFGQALQNAGLTNAARGQGFGERLQQAGFTNAARAQGFGEQLQEAGLSNSARAQGFGELQTNLTNNNMGRAQSLQERATLRNIPMQELSALRTGAQVTNPTFSTPGMQSQTSGPDLMGATQAQYGAQVGQVNANNAAAAQQTQAGVGLAGLAIAAFF